jgi:hypothetical protein
VDIETYLDLDDKNAKATLRILRDADSILALKRGSETPVSDLLEDGLSLFEAFQRAYGQGAGPSDDDDYKIQKECAAGLGVPGNELRTFVRNQPRDPGPSRTALIQAASAAVYRTESRHIRGIILPSIARSYMFGLTDLLRLRVSASVGYQRLAAEGAALIELFHREPSLAMNWADTQIGDPAFYRAHQGTLNEIMRQRNLFPFYDAGSGIALHVRLAGLAQALSVETSHEADRLTIETKLSFQEIQGDDQLVRRVLLYTLSHLACFGHVFAALVHGLPELSGILLDTRVPRFQEAINLNREKFKNTYAKWIEEHT